MILQKDTSKLMLKIKGALTFDRANEKINNIRSWCANF